MKAEGELQLFIWDTQAWAMVVTECRKLPIDEARKMMDRVMQQFPSCALYWKDYAQMEFNYGDQTKALDILKKTLYKYPSEHLWNLYLNHLNQELLEKMKNISTSKDKMLLRQHREDMRRALSEAQKRFGSTLFSKFIWDMSLDIAKKSDSDINVIRDLYKKALSLPIYDLESLWEEYKEFERPNGELGKKKIIELNNKFDPTKKILRDKSNIWKTIHVDAPAVPPLGSPYEKEQLQIWRRAIQFELENHEGISREELCFRMRTLFTQCLCVMRYHPDMWYDFAMFERENGTIELTLKVLREACKTIPESLYLHFSYADILESEKRIVESQTVYEDLIYSNPYILINIVYQRFLLRNKSINEVRDLFRRTIANPDCGYSIYVSMGKSQALIKIAIIEYYYEHNAELARRVFQVGYNYYYLDPNFILRFLTWINDFKTMENILEKAIKEIPENKLGEVCTFKLNYIQWKCDTNNTLEYLETLEDLSCKSQENESAFQGLLSKMHRYDNFGLSSLSDIDISLKERYYVLCNQPLGEDRLENRVIPNREKSLIKSNIVVGDMPDFIANWIKNLPEGRETEVSSDLLIELIIMKMKSRPILQE